MREDGKKNASLFQFVTPAHAGVHLSWTESLQVDPGVRRGDSAEGSMILSTKGRYAVMAMVDLARQPTAKPVTLAAIAERQEIPLAYLEQIFVRLKRAGLITSVRGPGGGYRLAHPASEMPVADIMLASEEPLKMTRCSSQKEEGCMSQKTRCLTHDLWDGLSAQIQHYLENITLADVCEKRVNQKFPRAKTAIRFPAFAEFLANEPV